MTCSFLLLVVSVILLPLSPGADNFPPTLSATHLFTDLRSLSASSDLIPYGLNVSFWSDGAEKKRWFRLPAGGKIQYSPQDQWTFPAGILFVKHFENQGRNPIETRLLLYTGTNISGASYRWRDDRTDADLLSTNLQTRDWYFPSREDCRTCHNANAGFILGLNTRQLNRRSLDREENQIVHWSDLGLIKDPPTPSELQNADYLRCDSTEAKIRAYLDVNCAFCHTPGGTVAYFDARFSNPIARLINAPVYFNQGIDNARVIAPRDPWRSLLLLRLQATDGLRMPPLAHQRVDTNSVSLLLRWIDSLEGAPVLPPPSIQPSNGQLCLPAKVGIAHPDAGAVIRYTIDGSPPGKNSPIYSGPITLSEPVTIRARAYKDGFTRSVAAQQTFSPTR